MKKTLFHPFRAAAGLALLLAATAAGGAFMQWRRTPNPWVLGALIVSMAISASGTTLSAVPGGLSNAAQLAIGVNLGVRFTPDFVRAAPRWLSAVALGTLVMVALSAGFGALLACTAAPVPRRPTSRRSGSRSTAPPAGRAGPHRARSAG